MSILRIRFATGVCDNLCDDASTGHSQRPPRPPLRYPLWQPLQLFPQQSSHQYPRQYAIGISHSLEVMSLHFITIITRLQTRRAGSGKNDDVESLPALHDDVAMTDWVVRTEFFPHALPFRGAKHWHGRRVCACYHPEPSDEALPPDSRSNVAVLSQL